MSSLYLPHPADPFLPADWRHRRASYLVTSGGRVTARDDGHTRSAVRFLRARQRGQRFRDRQDLPHDLSALAPAFEAHLTWPALQRAELQARLLADQANAEIAAACALPQDAVNCYEKVFFDVRPHLAATYYIIRTVIGYTPLPRGEADPLKLLRFYGYLRGPLVLEPLLRILADPTTTSATGNKPRNDLLTELQVRLALLTRQLPVSPHSVVRLHVVQSLVDQLRAAIDSVVRLPSPLAGLPIPAALFTELERDKHTPTYFPEDVLPWNEPTAGDNTQPVGRAQAVPA